MATVTPLCADMVVTKKMALAGLAAHPGYAVLIEMFNEACSRATKDIAQLEPGSEGYATMLPALHLRFRERNEFSSLILKSIDWHVAGIDQAAGQ